MLIRKGFARAVFADYQTKRRAAIGDAVQVFVERGDLGIAPDLHVSGTKARGDTCTQRLDESIALTRAKSWAEHVEWLYFNGDNILRRLRIADGEALKHD